MINHKRNISKSAITKTYLVQMFVVLALAGTLMLTGCVAKKTFTKPGLTQTQWSQDLAECEYEVALSTQNVNYGYTSTFAQALDQALRRRDLIEMCLKVRGYTEHKQ